ncbi:MAG: helix-turn-helix domain-containing protein [Halanaerobiales bacterium]
MSSVPALNRGLNILELIGEKKEITFTEIKDKTGINSTSLSRILNLLVEKGYLKKNIHKKYTLGGELILLAQKSSLWELLSDEASIILSEITSKFDITACLYGFTHKGITVLDKVVHSDNVALRNIGEVKKDYILSPWGFIYVAHQKNQKNFIKKVKANGWCDLTPPPDNIINRLVKEAKKNKVADDEGRIIEGIRRLAVPVYGYNQDLIASLGVGSFEELLNNKPKLTEIKEFIKEKGEELSRLIQS